MGGKSQNKQISLQTLGESDKWLGSELPSSLRKELIYATPMDSAPVEWKKKKLKGKKMTLPSCVGGKCIL